MTYAHYSVTPSSAPITAKSAVAIPSTNVTGAIQRASAKSGVDFSYLMDKAKIESSMNPGAQAKGSSATGLYQFIEKTWLEMVRNYGDKYGLSTYANCIDQNCQVNNPAMRQKILDLRKDPETSACMAAEYASQNARALQSTVGDITTIGDTELYMAHFLGAGGASKFLTAMDKNPDTRAATIFPAEARSNPGIFYNNETGKARTLGEIYARFEKQFSNETPGATTVAMAQKSGTDIPVTDMDDVAANTTYAAPVSTLMPCDIEPTFVEKLLAQGPMPFNKNGTNDAPIDTVAAIQETITKQQQSALLILAQTYAHNDDRRYNG